jgi:hypothetical protein
MKAIKDLFKVKSSLNPASSAATVSGTAVDLANAQSCMVTLTLGAWATDGVYAYKLQESATTTDGDFTDVAAADLVGAFTNVTDNAGVGTVQKVSYIGSKRYIRVVETVSGHTSGSLIRNAIVVMGMRKLPAA